MSKKKQSQVAISEIWARIAHKIRNPLTSISTSGQLLQTRLSSDSQNLELADMIVSETERLDLIIETLDWLFRPLSPSLSETDLAKCIESAISFLEIGGISKGIRICRDYESPPVVIEADRDMVSRIFLNLVTNAVEAMGDSGTLALRVASCREGAMAVVADDGPGIKEGADSSVFNILSSAKRGHLGLGLPVSRRLAEAHGGRLSLQPNLPRGTAAELVLPQAPPRRLRR